MQTEWTTESLDSKHISWKGSWDNSEKIRVLGHSVKFYKENNNHEWAFKVSLAYLKNISDDTVGTYAKKMRLWTPPSNAELCMPVDKIRYELYDNDDFLLDSISIVGDCITYTDTITFQSKKKIRDDLAEKFSYGKLNVKAGYYIKK